jgi:hypothetical protein
MARTGRSAPSLGRVQVLQTRLPPPPIATLQDAFVGSVLNSSLWQVESGTVSVSGQLNLTATSGYSGVVSRNRYRLTGSAFLLQLTPMAVGNGTNQVGFGLRPHQLDNNIGSLGADVGGSGPPPTLEATYRDTSGTQHLVGAGIPCPTGASPIWLRVRESAGTVYWDWSADNLNWTNVWSLADPFSTDALYVEIFAGHYGAETDTIAALDNVNVLPALTTPVAAAATAAAAYVTGGPVQQMFPSGDLTATGWTPSSGTSLSAMLSDQADATYDFSPV